MLKLNGSDIILTRGDSLNLKVAIIKNKVNSKLPNGREIVKREDLPEGTKIFFNMSRFFPGQLDYKLIIADREIPTQTMDLRLMPSDTKDVPLGIYNYDISMHYPQEDSSEEKIDTFISGTFQLVGECNGEEGIVNDYRTGANTI